MVSSNLNDPEIRARLGRLVRGVAPGVAAELAPQHLRRDAVADAVAIEGFPDPVAGYRDLYLTPLLRVLGECLAGAGEGCEAVYADERSRFAPDGVLAPVLDDDERELVRLCDGDAGLAEAMRLELARLHRPLRERRGLSVSMVLVGDCLMTELRAFAAVACRERGLALDTRHQYFSARQGVALASDEVTEALAQRPADLIALSFLTFEGIPAYRALLARADRPGASVEREVDAIVGAIATFVEDLRAVTSTTILLHGACGLPLSRWRRRLRFMPPLSAGRRRAVAMLNERLDELAGATENAVFIDEAAVTAAIGVRAAGDPLLPRNLTEGAVFHTTRLGRALAPQYAELAAATAALRAAKVLLVDFDNTLWRGVIGEGDVVHDHGRQRLLRELREAGVLLVALSKNSPDSIRWDEMELSPDDFVLHKISWNQKAQSALEAAEQLDLSPDSFVLLDDNPAERELLRTRLPQIHALDPEAEETWRALRLMLELPVTGRSAEAAHRTEMYRQAASRREAMAQPLDLGEMMGSLELRASFGAARHDDLPRVHELLARTSQFNTTTRRRSESELRELLSSDRHGVYVASLDDKFGALGLVGIVIVERDGDVAVIDSIVMSCRAMGFGLEYAMLRGALDAEAPWREAVGRYIPTRRNDPCSGLFSSAGFRRRDEHDWELGSGEDGPVPPEWLAVVSR
ncbi:MAG TPA: HAD-IIIC family phosphatase [Solirubrobacteraceae bacterium]|nr:HAD-IIIC family phosphatase [Solirubrobacteraceae bacterium]